MGSPTTFPILILGFNAIVAIAADLDLVLVHINDMHSRFDETDEYGNECREDDGARGLCYGGFSRVARAVEDQRRWARESGLPSLFAVAGDTFQGTPYFSFFKWRPVLDFVKRLRPDVMTLGNHEFDAGIESLVSYLDGINSTGIPTVVSNLNATMEPELDKFLLPSMVFTFNDTKVGVVGYLTTETPHISSTGDVKFYDEVESLKKETKKLRDSGVNIIIGLGHSGIEIDEIVAKEVEDIDLIVGGHSHTFLWTGTPPSIENPYGPYPLIVKNVKKKNVPILQVFANCKYLGKVHLHFDSNGDLITIDGSPILLNKDIEQDPSMFAVVEQWRPKVVDLTNITVGHTAVKLLNNCHQMECNIGNVITDAFVYYNVIHNNKKLINNQRWTDAPIALLQAGGIRTSIDETNHDGFISLGQLINVMPFMNNLVKVTVNGSHLLDAFEHSVSDYDINLGGGSRLLQMSGAFVEYDLTHSVGHRVVSVSLRCGDCRVPKYEPLVLTKNYTIVMNDFLANGGDNYKFKNTMVAPQPLGIEDVNATATYMMHISPIVQGLDGRIVFRNRSFDGKSKAFAAQCSHLLMAACAVLFCGYQNYV